MVKIVSSYVEELDSDLRRYRLDFNNAFSRRLSQPKYCVAHFFALLSSTSRLYLDYLILRKLDPAILTTKAVREQRRLTSRTIVTEEAKVREKLRKRLTSIACWSKFNPANYFIDENQLQTNADYVSRLELHLPEIFSETTNLGRHVRKVIREDGFSDFCLAELLVRLEHVAHHASYCRHALEILSNEGSWML